MKKLMIMSAKVRTLRYLLAATILLLVFSGSRCLADPWEGPLTGTYYGTSSGIGDLMTTDGWMSPSTSFHWNIWRAETEPGSGVYTGPWHYEYEFYSSVGALSHGIIQVSYDEGELDPFDPSNPMDYVGVMPEGGIATWYGPASGNPYMPATIYGMKFNEGAGTTVVNGTWSYSFTSWRNPMEGSFYAKDGKHPQGSEIFATAWNSGLEYPETGVFIPVPNGSYVPVPGAVLLGILGLGAAGIKLRRFA